MTRSLLLFAAVVALAALAQGQVRRFATAARRNIEWIDFKTGDVIPENAVYAGQEPNGGAVYVGRGKYKNQHTPGKVVSKNGVFYMGYNGQEIPLEEYQILVADAPVYWKKVDPSEGIPENAILGGHNQYEVEYYVCRALYDDKFFIPGKMDRATWLCYTENNDLEYSHKDFQILLMAPDCVKH